VSLPSQAGETELFSARTSSPPRPKSSDQLFALVRAVGRLVDNSLRDLRMSVPRKAPRVPSRNRRTRCHPRPFRARGSSKNETGTRSGCVRHSDGRCEATCVEALGARMHTPVRVEDCSLIPRLALEDSRGFRAALLEAQSTSSSRSAANVISRVIWS
jgi:hypothetical protein